MQLTAPMPGCIKPRDGWVYVSGPHRLVTGSERTYDLPTRGPALLVQVHLVCLTANNGYKAGDEIPIHLLTRDAAGNDDGAPRWSYRINGSRLTVYVASSTIQITDSTGGIGTFTASQWQLKLYAIG